MIVDMYVLEFYFRHASPNAFLCYSHTISLDAAKILCVHHFVLFIIEHLPNISLWIVIHRVLGVVYHITFTHYLFRLASVIARLFGTLRTNSSVLASSEEKDPRK